MAIEFPLHFAIFRPFLDFLGIWQDLMVDLSWSHGRLLQQLVEMGALKMRPQAASVFAVEVQHLQQDLEEIRELLKNSWWEPVRHNWLTG